MDDHLNLTLLDADDKSIKGHTQKSFIDLRSVDEWFDFINNGEVVGSIHLKCEWYFSILPGVGAESLRALKGPQPTQSL